jgi:NAD+ synthase (glutamine-hydrolysing)
MRIALAQMRVLPARPEQNFKTIRDRIEQAKSLNCHIVAFPEMCVGGYLLGDLWTDDVWCEYLDGFNEKIREISDGIVVIYGNVRLDKKKVNKDGRCRKYNAGLAWYNRKPVLHKSIIPQGIAIKSLLPNYRIFDDERYFFSLQEISLDVDVPIGQLLQPFELTIEGKSYRIGVEICEDLWFNDYRYRGRPLNISRYLVGNGAQCIFNLSSSPWTWGKDQARNNRIRDSINDCDSFVPFYYVNCVGVQNNGKNIVVFDGDSTVYNEKGQVVIAAAKPYEEELIVFNDNPLIAGETKKQPELVEAKYQAIIQGIKGMDEIMGSSTFPYIIGLSGGIDSALVACLVTAAVGKKRIIACNLPTRYNSAQTRSIAGQVAKALGISLHTIPIEEIVSMNEHLVEQFHPTGFHRENIQAKIRGTTILSNIAGITGGLLTCNGNKIEIALGYATLYGDVNGALAPIGDLLKTEIFRMAQYVNTQIFNETVIPASLIPDELFTF